MNVLTYLLIGTIFMASIEALLSSENIQSHLPDIPELGGVERAIGIIFWPVCLGVFIYYFFKTLFK